MPRNCAKPYYLARRGAAFLGKHVSNIPGMAIPIRFLRFMTSQCWTVGLAERPEFARDISVSRVVFFKTVNTFVRCPPFCEVEEGRPHNRRLLADLKVLQGARAATRLNAVWSVAQRVEGEMCGEVCSKLQAQKDFMRPGW